MPFSSHCRALCLVILLCFSGITTADTLKGLILTSPGVYHNYEYQNQAIANAIASRVNIQFDISLAETERWKNTDFSEGYDVLIYNICMADNKDGELIANMRRQSAELDVPAMVVHCAMHSFRETDLWWPLYGLKTVAHENLRAMPQEQAREHPVLTGIPADWVVAEDELYINLAFEATPILTSKGEDGADHVTTWLAMEGNAPVFGTTLGHSNETIEDPIYQQLLTNALLLVTGNQQDDGAPRAGLEPVAGATAIGKLTKAEGVEYLGEDGQSCVRWGFVKAIGPCYLGCILNPLEWGEETQVCKDACVAQLPSSDEMILQCTP